MLEFVGRYKGGGGVRIGGRIGFGIGWSGGGSRLTRQPTRMDDADNRTNHLKRNATLQEESGRAQIDGEEVAKQ